MSWQPVERLEFTPGRQRDAASSEGGRQTRPDRRPWINFAELDLRAAGAMSLLLEIRVPVVRFRAARPPTLIRWMSRAIAQDRQYRESACFRSRKKK